MTLFLFNISHPVITFAVSLYSRSTILMIEVRIIRLMKGHEKHVRYLTIKGTTKLQGNSENSVELWKSLMLQR